MSNIHRTPHLLEIKPNVGKLLFKEGYKKPTIIVLDEKYTLLVLHNEKKVYNFSYRESKPFHDKNGKVGVCVNIFGKGYKVVITNRKDLQEIINTFISQAMEFEIKSFVRNKGTNHE